jgi:hypothetical protein
MTDKTAIYPISLFVLTCLIWLSLWVQSHRLLFKFRKKYPDIARKDIPYVFNDAIRHPDKFLYFIRSKNRQALSKDPEISSLGRQVLILFRLAILVPLVGFLILLIFVVSVINL